MLASEIVIRGIEIDQCGQATVSKLSPVDIIFRIKWNGKVWTMLRVKFLGSALVRHGDDLRRYKDFVEGFRPVNWSEGEE